MVSPAKRRIWIAMNLARDYRTMDRDCFEKLSTTKQEAMKDERHETNDHVLLGSSAWTGVACWYDLYKMIPSFFRPLQAEVPYIILLSAERAHQRPAADNGKTCK